MPAKLHRLLERQADKKGLKGRRRDAYIYGTMQRIDKERKGAK